MVHISTQAYRESRENPNEADMAVYKGLVNKGYDAFFLEGKSPWLKASNCAWGATRMDIKKELRRVLEEIELKEKT
jgi:hypothetical protein